MLGLGDEERFIMDIIPALAVIGFQKVEIRSLKAMHLSYLLFSIVHCLVPGDLICESYKFLRLYDRCVYYVITFNICSGHLLSVSGIIKRVRKGTSMPSFLISLSFVWRRHAGKRNVGFTFSFFFSKD